MCSEMYHGESIGIREGKNQGGGGGGWQKEIYPTSPS